MEQRMDEMYDLIQKEQAKLMMDIKSGCEASQEADNFKQFNLMNTINNNLLKLKSLKRKIKAKLDN